MITTRHLLPFACLLFFITVPYRLLATTHHEVHTAAKVFPEEVYTGAGPTEAANGWLGNRYDRIQVDSIPFLSPTDSVMLTEDPLMGRIIFTHQLLEGQSLYSVAKFYGLTLDDVYYLNPLLKGGYDIGDQVRIVLPPVAIRTYVPYDSIDYYVPLFWELKKGQTLYGLTHRILKLPSEQTLLNSNLDLSASSMKVGQLLFIGWLSTGGISSEMQGEVEDPYVKLNTGLRKQWASVSKGKALRAVSGKAAWTRNGDRNKFMALHRTAPINSLIEVMDKRTGKVLYCRVVGRIPDQVYDQNVKVVVSPLLVKAFGVQDRYFYVQVKSY